MACGARYIDDIDMVGICITSEDRCRDYRGLV